MPVVGLGLHVLIAIYFATHAVRSGQDKYWLWVLFAFPLLGSLVYGVTIWLPDARHSCQGQQVIQGVRKALDPSRELRSAQDALELAATPANRLRLAEALLEAGRASEAVVQFQAVLTGLFADDAAVQVRLARALLESGNPLAARDLLSDLIAKQPNFKSPEGHLVFARSLAALDDRPRAREEFEVLVGYFAGLEAKARYAEILQDWGDAARLSPLLEEARKSVKRMSAATRDLNREWIERLRRVRAPEPA
jgi:hypothetical protein